MKNSNAFTLLLCCCYVLSLEAFLTGPHFPMECTPLLGFPISVNSLLCIIGTSQEPGSLLNIFLSDTHLENPSSSPDGFISQNSPESSTALCLHHLYPCQDCHHFSPDDHGHLLTESPHASWAPFNLPFTLLQR